MAGFKARKKPKYHAIERHGHEAYVAYCQKVYEQQGRPFTNPYTATREERLAHARAYHEAKGERWDDWARRAKVREEWARWRAETLPVLRQRWDDELLRALAPHVSHNGYAATLNLNAEGKKHSSVARCMAAVVLLARGRGRLFASNRTIARAAGLGLTNAKECVALLESCGALKRVRSGGLKVLADGTFKTRSNVYLVSYQQMRRIAGVPLNGFSRYEAAELFDRQLDGEDSPVGPWDALYEAVVGRSVFRRAYGKRAREDHPFFEEGTVRARANRDLKALIRQNFHNLDGERDLIVAYAGRDGREDARWEDPNGYVSLLWKSHDLGKRGVSHKVPTTNKRSLFGRNNNRPQAPERLRKPAGARPRLAVEDLEPPSISPSDGCFSAMREEIRKMLLPRGVSRNKPLYSMLY